MQEGALWMHVQCGTCTHPTRTAHWVWVSTVSGFALIRPWELFVPSICSIRGCDLSGVKGLTSPLTVTRGHRWHRGDSRSSPGFNHVVHSVLEKTTVKLQPLCTFWCGCVLLCVPHKISWPYELLWLCIFSSKDEWLTFMTRSCLSVDWFILIIILSSNRSKALI